MYLPRWNYDFVMSEIIRFCEETGTRHVMLFTDAQHMVWNQLTIEEAKEETATIVRAIDDLAKHGIKVGINSSYNQIPSNFDNSGHTPQYKHWVTYADGICEKRTPCLLDPALKDYLTEFYGILANTKAEYIYIDDDHRYVFNGIRNTWGCMCDLHLSKFSELTGQIWTRESLQNALFSDQKIRCQWSQFLGSALNDLTEVIEKAVHRVNPEMRIGIMVPCLHCSTNFDYDLKKTAQLFQPDGNYLLRPCIGPYSDRDRQQIVPGLFYMETIKHIMGDSSEYTPELEPGPYTRLNKSTEVIRFHICQGIINGMNNPAISVCGYVGDDPYLEPDIAKMLKRDKAYFEALRKIAPEDGTKKGIGLRFHRKHSSVTPNNYKNVSDYYLPAFVLHDFLAHLGFCLTYDKSKINYLAGDSVYCFTDEELKEYLKGNLILDAVAAKAFADRGFLKYTGASAMELEGPYGAEYLSDPEFCGKYTGRYIYLKNAPLGDIGKLSDIQPGARVLTTITDHNRKEIGTGMTLFENELGGKVLVSSIRINPAAGLINYLANYHRQLLLKNVFKYMDPQSLPVYVEEPTCMAVQYFDNGKDVLIGLVNTSYDIAHETVLELTDPSLDMAQASYLRDDGELRPLSEIASLQADGTWKIVKDLSIFHYLAIQIRKK